MNHRCFGSNEDADETHQKEAYSLQEVMYNPVVAHSVRSRLATGEGCLSVDRNVSAMPA